MKISVINILLVISTTFSYAQQWSEVNDEGMARYREGSYKEAEVLFRQAAAIALKSVGTNSAEYITAMTNVGYSAQALGDFKTAQNAFRTSASVSLKVYPDQHIEQVDAFLNFANAFLPAGEYDSCERYVMIANEWITNNVAKRTDHYLQNIPRFFDASINANNTIASLSYKKGQYRKAADLMAQQRTNIQGMYPDDYRESSVYQSTLNNLSTYYLAAGQTEQARQIISEQVDIAYKKDKNGLEYFYALNNLGSIFRSLEQYDSAIANYSRAARAIETTHKGSDLHIALLNNLGEIYAAMDSTMPAIRYLNESISLQESRAGVNPRVYQSTLLNLGETYRWSGSLKKAEDIYIKLTSLLIDEILHNYTYLSDEEKISFFRSNIATIEYFSSLAFELSGDVRFQKSDNYFNKKSLAVLFDLLLATKGLILHPGLRIRTNILTGNDLQLKTRYQEWEDKKYLYASQARQENADPKKLAQLSHEIEALEKWLRSTSPQFKKEFAVDRKTWKDVQKSLKPNEAAVEIVRLTSGVVYGALILTSSTKEGPKTAVIKSKPDRYLEKHLYRGYANSVIAEQQDTISYDIFIKPIMDVIVQNTPKGKVEKIYISYDGVYHQVNLNTLLNPVSRKYVIDEVDIHPVTNLKEILEVKQTTAAHKKDAVLFGRPLYKLDGEKSDLVISDLPGTEKEVDEIGMILKAGGWKPSILKDRSATERKAKTLSSPQVVHFATHGFVVRDTVTNELVNTMLNSGIILAGAGDKELHDGDDGVLTAYEMMNVDLEATELVVLSACETGLGEFFSGEGIYGLQRAIRSAGAKSVIMSLWKVDDTATQLLMTEFYRNWIQKGLDRRTAFRVAQVELRKKYGAARYWGAFVFVGE